MTEPVVVPPGGGEVVRDTPERRVEIIAEQESLHATWARMGPGGEGADLHVHRRHSDLFYVLAGELTVRLGHDGQVAVPAGTLARIPPMVVHGFRNTSDAEVRYLNFHAPGVGFADYLRALRDGRTLAYDQEPPPAQGTRPPSEAAIGGARRLGDGAALLADVPEIHVTEVRAEPGAAPQPRPPGGHLTSLYVLDGELTVRIGGRELRAAAGSWAELPPDAEYALAYAAPVRFLAVRTPQSSASRS